MRGLRHFADIQIVWKTATDGQTRSYSEKRLSLLRSKFAIHANLNEVTELALMSAVPKRDFYNVLKVDTHVHAAACMTTRTLLKRVKEAVLEEPDIEVLPGKTEEDPPIKLLELFQSLELDPEHLSVDSLDVRADRRTRHRFDRFDNLYNVAGEAELRQVFLKPTKNLVRGRYFADLVKESLKSIETKCEYAELRLTVGSSLQEWKELATWAKKYNVYSDHNRWVLQVPRIYSQKRQSKAVENFEDFLSSVFLPLFLATSDPESYSEIATLLEYVVAIDSVSDESLPEVPVLTVDMPTPAEWTSEDNPPYAYYLYYMYANLSILNQFRKMRGMNILKLRPHSGESGSAYHLASAFLLAENISHGIELTQSPPLEYLYYLAQISIAMSPLSNHNLFLPYGRNPLKKFFAEGIPVTLSTDDPLMFHMTSDPLVEEYSVASIVFGLSFCDQCELARNSVLMSGFSDEIKAHWLGKDFKEDGIAGNHIGFSNVPDVRIAYRHENLRHELKGLRKDLLKEPMRWKLIKEDNHGICD